MITTNKDIKERDHKQEEHEDIKPQYLSIQGQEAFTFLELSQLQTKKSYPY